MSWIESHQSLARHRKTVRAGALLNVDRHKLIGHLHCLWWWALDNVPADGGLGDLSDQEIAFGAEWEGDAATFATALHRAGFIDVTPEGRFLHDWWEYAGKLLDQREAGHAANQARRAEAERRVLQAIAEIEGRGETATLSAVQRAAGCGRSTAQRVLQSRRSSPSGPGGPSRGPVRSEPTQPNPTEPNRTGGGWGEPAAAPPLAATATAADDPGASEREAAIVRTLLAIPGYDRDAAQTLAMVREQSAIWPLVNQRAEAAKFAAWWEDTDRSHPHKRSNWRLRWGNWIEKAGKERGGGNGVARQPLAEAPQALSSDEEVYADELRARGLPVW